MPQIEQQEKAKVKTIDNEKLLDKLAKIDNLLQKSDQIVKNNWDLYEKFYLGSQWDTKITKLQDYNSEGELVITRTFEPDKLEDSMPKRTLNYCFIQTQTEKSMLSELNPTVITTPKSDQFSKLCEKLNILNEQLFGDLFKKHYEKAILQTIIYGHSFFKIKISVPKNPQEYETLPIQIITEHPKDISVDANADDWSDVRWIKHKIKKYVYEIKEKYENFNAKNYDDYEMIELTEYWINNNGIWEQYLTHKSQLLKVVQGKDGYPICIYEPLKLYQRDRGWFGISEIGLIIDYQKTINKRLSQRDYHINFLIDPPTVVIGGLLNPGEISKLPLRPGEFYTSKAGGAMQPLVITPVNEATFLNDISFAIQNIEETTGITKANLGVNPTGVYSAKHFNAIKESSFVRIKNKEYYIRYAIENIAMKCYIILRELLRGGRKLKIYDYTTNNYIYFTEDDFDLRKYKFEIEIIDAKVIEPSQRLDTLIELKQYAPDFDTRELVLAINDIMPGLIPKRYIKRLKMILDKEYEDFFNQQKQQQENINSSSEPYRPPIEQTAEPQQTGEVSGLSENFWNNLKQSGLYDILIQVYPEQEIGNILNQLYTESGAPNENEFLNILANEVNKTIQK